MSLFWTIVMAFIFVFVVIPIIGWMIVIICAFVIGFFEDKK